MISLAVVVMMMGTAAVDISLLVAMAHNVPFKVSYLYNWVRLHSYHLRCVGSSSFPPIDNR